MWQVPIFIFMCRNELNKGVEIYLTLRLIPRPLLGASTDFDLKEGENNISRGVNADKRLKIMFIIMLDRQFHLDCQSRYPS